ncbi:hypothetical protein [Shewanella phaeophyticola]|uniref:Uncharacterized protein n=1 Tax=Shewanella phaeophyticola TaxID=2978345 RepID=A0ABT2NY15_9GAMM|nr:hypothetical protein [Shewanella sp. KJ10-1]MCT8985291.1 hypothetical protein [Shewanella sp. KJ10-1]
MALYKSEFGENFNLGFNIEDFPWLTDKSWHNDMCPSFYFKMGIQHLVLWVDFEAPDDREESEERYLVMTAINEGTDNEPEIFTSEDSEVVFTTESPSELTTYLKKLASAY